MNTRKKPGGRFVFGSGVSSIVLVIQSLFLLAFGVVGLWAFWYAFVVKLYRKGFTDDLWVGLLPLVFVAVSAGGIAALLWFHWVRDEEPLPASTVPEPGDDTLVPVETRWSRVRSSAGLAAFWNFIVLFFVAADVAIFMSGEKPALGVLLALFLIPFVLVGLHLAGNARRDIRGLLNPVPRITLGRAGLPVGEAVPFEWRFTGRTERFRGLRITLEGIEKATDAGDAQGGGRGGTTRSESKGFAEIEVFTSEDPAACAGGTGEIRVPAETVPSLRTKYAEISWRLRLSAPTVKKPHVEEEYDVVVVPGENAGGAR